MMKALPFFLILLLIPSAFALQVSPASRTFTLSEESSYELRVINDQRVDLAVTLEAVGELAPYIVFSEASFALPADEREHPVTVTLTQPSQELDPGKTWGAIKISATGAGDSQFGSVVSLLSNVALYRLYDGVFLEGTLLVDAPRQAGGEHLFSLGLENKGKSGTTALATMTILDGDVEIETFPLGETMIASEGTGKLEVSRLLDLPRGAYVAKASFSYDDRGEEREERFTAPFRVGSPLIVFERPTLTLPPDEIVTLPLNLTLDWNEPLTGALHLVLLDGDKVLAESLTPTQTLMPGMNRVNAFLELPLLGGDYQLRVEIRSGGRILSKESWDVRIEAGTLLPVGKSVWSGVIILSLILLLTLLAALLVKKKRKSRTDLK